MRYLKQSTSVDVGIGPFLDETDGKTAETALTITQPDVRLKKNGGAWAQKAAAQTLTHEENGWYELTLDATDTDTIGHLLVAIHESGALPVWVEFHVLAANVYDSLFGAATDKLDVNVEEWNATAVPAEHTAGYPIVTIKDGAGTGEINTSGGKVVEVETLTGHTAQTGDAFARLGAPAGASVSADIAAIKTETAAIKTRTDLLPAVAAGAAGGLLIAGSNAATTFATLAVTGTFIVSGTVTFGVFIVSGDCTFSQFTVTNTATIGALVVTNTVIVSGTTTFTGAITATNAGNDIRGITVSTLPSIPANWITAAGIANGAIDSNTFAAGTSIPRCTLVDTLTTYTGNTPQTGDSFARLGAPAGVSVSADIAAVKVDTAAILDDTGTSGVVVAAASKTGYSLVVTGLDLVLIDGKTLPAALQYIAASTAGKVSGAGTGTEVFKGLDGTTTRLTVTVDSSGNRTAITYG